MSPLLKARVKLYHIRNGTFKRVRESCCLRSGLNQYSRAGMNSAWECRRSPRETQLVTSSSLFLVLFFLSIYLFKAWRARPPSGTFIKRPVFHPLLLLDDKPINCSIRVTPEVQKLTIALADQRKNITIRQVQHCWAISPLDHWASVRPWSLPVGQLGLLHTQDDNCFARNAC